MAVLEIELDIPGLIELRCSGDAISACRSVLRDRMNAAGANDGYEITTIIGGGSQARAHVICTASSSNAMNDNYKNNTLAKVVG